jgi:hypothetical protein
MSVWLRLSTSTSTLRSANSTSVVSSSPVSVSPVMVTVYRPAPSVTFAPTPSQTICSVEP